LARLPRDQTDDIARVAAGFTGTGGSGRVFAAPP
jgi:hypothetical protein